MVCLVKVKTMSNLSLNFKLARNSGDLVGENTYDYEFFQIFKSLSLQVEVFKFIKSAIWSLHIFLISQDEVFKYFKSVSWSLQIFQVFKFSKSTSWNLQILQVYKMKSSNCLSMQHEIFKFFKCSLLKIKYLDKTYSMEHL